jgi:exopolysaccharide biosynthesis WecB/TagA/CpsF family protein/anti-anti-sigma factor
MGNRQVRGESVLDGRTPVESAAAPPPPVTAPPAVLLGVAFDPLTGAQALRRIEQMVASRRPHYVVTANVDFLVQALRDAELRRALIEADLVLCDGTPLRWASGWLGHPLPERVAGSDLAPEMIRLAARKNYRLFFLGSTPAANQAAVDRVRAQFPGVVIAGHYAPPFNSLLEMDHRQIARRIWTARPDVLLVAFGCPKAEKWMAMNYHALNVPVSIGVGATLDFLAGRMKRAPVWMRGAGLEWLFRLCQEPRRLCRRYARDLGRFGWALAAQWWRLPARSAPGRRSAWRRQVNGSAASWRVVRTSAGGRPASWCELQVTGRLDARAHSWLDAPEFDGNCLLDLTGVAYTDSSGVGALLHLRKRVAARGGRLVLVAPKGPVQRALRGLRLREFFPSAADLQQARRLMEQAKEVDGV